MKFKTHAAMQSCPDFNIDAQLDPIDFNTSAHGSFEATVDSISADVDEIPIRLAIPFLKRRGKCPVFASIGGFKIALSPFRVKTEGVSVRLEGVLGTKGIAGKMDSKVSCKTEIEMDGNLFGKIGSLTLKLGDEDVA